LSANGWVVKSEEDPNEGYLPEACWIIDPIDGTVNFSHGLPQFAISAGWVESREFQLGVVCAPAINELYFTLGLEKALFNGKQFSHVNRTWDDALVAASFAAHAPLQQYTLFQQVNESTRGCVRTGSAALNLCWAAAGKLQAAYGFNAKLWDVAGALAVARAANCEVRLRHHPGDLTLDYFVGSSEVVRQLVDMAQDLGIWA
jgi:myo-inositol-1(or 4)-monophosphatase